MKKDTILAKDYELYRTAKPKKNKEYYRNLSDKEEKVKTEKVEVKPSESESSFLPMGNQNAKG